MAEEQSQIENAAPRKKGSSIGILIGAFLLVIFLLFGFAIGASAFSLINWGEYAPGFESAGSSGTSCYLNDRAFEDTSTINTTQVILEKLAGDYPVLNDRKAELNKIVTLSKQSAVNPAILISFWGAEQSFNNPDKAFGCGVTDRGDMDYTGIDKQIDCSLGIIRDAIDVKGYYTTPEGANRWTRLLYHYVTGNSSQPEGNTNFSKKGYVSSSDSPRIKLLSMLVPDQVTCDTGFAQNNKFSNLQQVIELFGSTQAEVERHIVDTSFMDKSIRVNKVMVEPLKNVEREIKGVDYSIDSVAAYNWRTNVNDRTELSAHAFGLAIDINPDSNPNSGRPAGSARRDSSACQHDIPAGVVNVFKKNGFFWGAEYLTICDPMHFTYGGNWQ